MFTIAVIVMSAPDARRRIANAYEDARSLAAAIELDEQGSARPRIVACIERHIAYKHTGDVAAAAWMLMAIKERVSERNLPSWRVLRKNIDRVLRELPPPKTTALN